MGIAIFLLVNGRLQYHGLTVRGCFAIASSIARNWTMKFALLRAWLEGKEISWGTSRIAKEEASPFMVQVINFRNSSASNCALAARLAANGLEQPGIRPFAAGKL